MKVSSINDLSKKVFSGCSYRTNKLVPLSGSQTQTLSITGTTNVQFEIPTQCVNLSKSRVAFDMLIPLTASNANWVHADPLALISRIQLLTRGGVSLVDVNDCNKYSAIVQPLTTSVKELLQRSEGGSLAQDMTNTSTTVASSAFSPIQGIQSSGTLSNINYRPSANTTTNDAPEAAQLPYSEMRYVFASALGAALALSYQVALETVEHTLLSVNKNLYFGENLILSITFGPANTFAWVSTSVSNPSTSKAASAVPTVSNLSLYLKVEQNPMIIRGFQEKLMSPEGLSIITPYVYTSKLNTGASSTSSALNFRLNRGYGQRLLRVYSSVFNGTEIYNLALDRCNQNTTSTTNSNKVSTYRTLLNSVQLQDYNIDTSRSEDWLINSDLIEGCAITSVDQYKYLFTHIDDFSGRQSILEDGDMVNDTDICGRDLSEEQFYTAQFNLVSGQYNLFSVFVVQRELVIRQGQIMWV